MELKSKTDENSNMAFFDASITDDDYLDHNGYYNL